MLVFLDNMGREMGIFWSEVDTGFVKSGLAFLKFLR